MYDNNLLNISKIIDRKLLNKIEEIISQEINKDAMLSGMFRKILEDRDYVTFFINRINTYPNSLDIDDIEFYINILISSAKYDSSIEKALNNTIEKILDIGIHIDLVEEYIREEYMRNKGDNQYQMITYTYKCFDCLYIEDIQHSMEDKEKRKCPQCSSENFKRIINNIASPILKGRGFHKTDYTKYKHK